MGVGVALASVTALYTLHPCWITRPGYDPMSATAVRIGDHELFRTSSSSADTCRMLKTQPFVTPWRKAERWKRVFHCQKCGHYPPNERLGDDRLGFIAYCNLCVEILGRACAEANARMPIKGREFYCAKCNGIRPNAEMVPVGRDGRRRWRCMSCRRIEWNTRNRASG
jgi:hypothetical protein